MARVAPSKGWVDVVIGDSDSKSIARQWNREIEDEMRARAAQRDQGPWRAVVWGALWLVWLGALAVLIMKVQGH